MSETELVGVKGSSDCDVSSSCWRVGIESCKEANRSDADSEMESVRAGVMVLSLYLRNVKSVDESAEPSEHMVMERGEGGRWEQSNVVEMGLGSSMTTRSSSPSSKNLGP